MITDAYQVLGIAPDSDTETIRKAHRALVREWHPDINDSAEAPERFRQITEAFEILMDREQRRIHDLQHGYSKKKIARGEQQKFHISEERKAKAAETVNQWKQDYGTVMQARESARQKQIEQHRRAMRRARLMIAAIIVITIWAIWALTR